MNAFWLALGITFWAEMGDKTQFIALAYAARYRTRHVIIGILLGIAAMMLLAVGLGRLLGTFIPENWMQALSAVCFIGFALWTLLEKPEDESVETPATTHPILLVAAAFFLGELGDKTIFSTIALGATHSWLPVWAGAVSGMAAADGFGVALGRWLGNRLPEAWFRRASALTFFVFGLFAGTAWWAGMY